MARSQQAHWLDRIILESRPGRMPKADFDEWRNAHAGAIRRLRQRGATVPRKPPFLTSALLLGRGLIRSSLVRSAVAVAVLVGVVVLVASRTDRKPVPPNPPTATTEQTASSGGIDPAETEQRLADDLFARGDVQGLLSLLYAAQPKTVFAATHYLGQIGDESSLPTLQTFAAQWLGSARENPFQKAVDQIRRRHGLEDTTHDEPAVAVQAIQKPIQTHGEVRRLTCRGVVLDKTGTPVRDARVWVQNGDDDLAPAVSTDPQGKFRLTVQTDAANPTSRRHLVCQHERYALGWLRLPGEGEADDFNDCAITLYPRTTLAGVVTDPRGVALSGAIVEARIVPAHEPTSGQEYLYHVGNERAARTDAKGRFFFADIPEGSLLSLSASRQGYAAYDSREGYGRLLGTSPYLDPESHTVRAGRKDVGIELLAARGRIDGRIVDSNGSPYRQRAVLHCADWGNTTLGHGYSYSNGRFIPRDLSARHVCPIDDGGHFRIDLPVGGYVINAIDPVSGACLTPWVWTSISESGQRAEVTLQAGKPVDVTVRVRTRTGEPVDNALVLSCSSGTMPRYTDSNGLCVLHLSPDQPGIRVYGWPYIPRYTVSQETNGTMNTFLDVTVEASPQLRGRLVDESGSPVRGSVRPCHGGRVLTDRDGRFTTLKRFTNLVCHAVNLEGTRARVFSCEGVDERTEIEIQLEPLATLTGRVLDPNGVPADGVSLSFHLSVPRLDYADGSYSGDVRCKMFVFDGRFRLEAPVGLPQVLSIHGRECRGLSELIAPAPGRTYDLGDITLRPEGASSR